MRAARDKWIDEHENPVAMEVRDGHGNLIKTPFLVGGITATAEEIFDIRNEKPKPFMPAGRSLSDIEDELDGTIREYLTIEGIAVGGKPGDKIAFVSEVDRPQHPPILEGETHEEWFNRTVKTYDPKERTAAKTGSARADTDDLRRSTADDPRDGNETLAAGGDGSAELPSDMDRDAGRDGAVWTGDATASPTTTAVPNGSSAHADATAVTEP